MKEQQKARFLVAAPECAKAKVGEILQAIGFEPDEFCLSGEAAIAAAQDKHVLLLTTYQLSDMTGAELAKALKENADVLMIVPADYEEETESGALLLKNPITQEALHAAIAASMHMQKKLLEIKARAEKSERQLRERKIIDRAKGRLMDEKHMSEKEAHYLIQKRSMDLGKRIVDIAQEILEAQEIEG